MKEFIQVRKLRKVYVKSSIFGIRKTITAVDDVTLTIRKGETLGLVGESGSGKTTLGRILAGLEEPDEGEVIINGVELRKYLRKNRIKVQLIFQNPDTSLDPRQKVHDVIREALEAAGEKATTEVIHRILNDVGLSKDIASRYPHELSGGQKQRVAIARAISVKPEFIVADEIISALDATIKVRILRLIKRLQQQHGFSMLFISHDLPITASVSDNVAVMYLGRIVEYGPSKDVLYTPRHPYTAHLVSSVPKLYFNGKWRPPKTTLHGDVLDTPKAGRGCLLYPRCPNAIKRLCDQITPEPVNVGNRVVACHNPLPSTKTAEERRTALSSVLLR